MIPRATPPAWSLRRRLTARVIGLVMLGWLATIGLSVWVLNHEMNEMFDEELRALVETTVLFLDASQHGAIPLQLGVETRDGERVLRILPNALPPLAETRDAPWPPLSEDGLHDAPGWRILRFTAEGAVIEAAHATTWRREEMTEAATAFAALALPMVAALVWGLGRIAGATTAPVAQLAQRIARRGPDDLAPLRATGVPQELVPLTEAFNSYLARIDGLRRAERDFTGNAAHELRTPLAAIRSRIELSPDPDARAALPMVDALTPRVERLLQLARVESGLGLGRGPSDLLRIIRMVLDDIRPHSRHPIRFDDSDLAALWVAVDADAAAIVLRNLIENAAEHGTGEVRVRLTPDGVLTVENPANHPTLTEARFAKGGGSGGLGLGLSILRAMTGALGTPMDIQATADHVRFRLMFPLGPERAA